MANDEERLKLKNISMQISSNFRELMESLIRWENEKSYFNFMLSHQDGFWKPE